MIEKIQRFFRGIGFLFLIASLIVSLTYLQLGWPFDVLAKWLSQSRDPLLALMFFRSYLLRLLYF